MRVLVTGAAGFIGSHLVDSLMAQRHEVMVLDDFSTGRLDHLDIAFHHGLEHRRVVRCDVADAVAAESVHEFRPDVMMLLAAQTSVSRSMREPRRDLEINLVGLLNMHEAGRGAGVRRVVFASSGGTIYGTAGEKLPRVGEMVLKRPASFYGMSKYACGEYLRLYHEHFGIEYVALALGNVYGPRQNPNGESGVVAIFVDQLSRGLPCTIYGDGASTRDYVHVRDAVEAFVLAATRGCGLVNIGTGVETSVLDVYRLVAAQLGAAPRPVFRATRPGEARRIALDPALAQRMLGWRPSVALADGIGSLVEHARASAAVAHL